MSKAALSTAGPPQGAKVPRTGEAGALLPAWGSGDAPAQSVGVALVMAGGTGGHIFPGLAVAEALRERGWRVHWLGAPASMESRIVPEHGFALELIDFAGVRGKGFVTLALLPLRLLKAFWQSIAVLRRVKPNVVVGLGGYITFPAGMMSVLLGKKLVLHEQNSVAGMANKILAGVADRVFTAFPNVIQKATWVGNPLRAAFLQQDAPEQRFVAREGVLKLLVVGGSLGAKALNEIVPKALALINRERRPQVTHQGGAKQIDELRANYAAAGVQAQLTPFIDDTARAFAEADVVICRAGASTVCEIAAVGAAAVFVPFPYAVDDHQTTNARFLVDQGGGWLMPQTELTPERLAQMLQKMERAEILNKAQAAHKLAQANATQAVVRACEELAA
jgi:UDP-N-acetylglucosamine--N-acetylmuramyl-(pentapeptide) pyrophosphoryl-undecaprenol N-acetylglucosamine transferase